MFYIDCSDKNPLIFLYRKRKLLIETELFYLLFGNVKNYAYLCLWFTVIHGRFHPRSVVKRPTGG